MNCYLPEGLHPQPDGYTQEELRFAMAQRRILQATAVRCDERHDLHVQLGCCEGLIPRAERLRVSRGKKPQHSAASKIHKIPSERFPIPPLPLIQNTPQNRCRSVHRKTL